MAVNHTQESFFRGLLKLATKRLRPALELPMACLPTVESSCSRSSHWRFLANSLLELILPAYNSYSVSYCNDD